MHLDELYRMVGFIWGRVIASSRERAKIVVFWRNFLLCETNDSPVSRVQNDEKSIL